jgi:alpha-ribazole phosphatase
MACEPVLEARIPCSGSGDTLAPAPPTGCASARRTFPVDRRKAKRLARRVQRAARTAGLARVVITSNLRRSADVGRWLRRWGWVHRIDAALIELDFGDWEGRPWDAIDRVELDTWCADFSRYAPGGGECLHAMLERATSWQAAQPAVVIGHAGWMLARLWLQGGRAPPTTACEWPAAPRHGELWRLRALVHHIAEPP